MNKFLTKNDVKPYAREYLAELKDIAQHYINLIVEHDEDKNFIKTIFEKVKCCTNPSKKVVLLADENVSLDSFARASLQDKTIVIYFNPKLFDTFKNLKLMFDLAEQFIWHEATHLARMDILGTDEAHNDDISDNAYLGSDAELNAFAIQSLSTTDDRDLAMDTYESCASDEVYDKFINVVDELANNNSPSLFDKACLKARFILDKIEEFRSERPFTTIDEESENYDVPSVSFTIKNSEDNSLSYVRNIEYVQDEDVILISNKFIPSKLSIDIDDVMTVLANHLDAPVKVEYHNGDTKMLDVIDFNRDYSGPTYDDEGWDFLEFIAG